MRPRRKNVEFGALSCYLLVGRVTSNPETETAPESWLKRTYIPSVAGLTAHAQLNTTDVRPMCRNIGLCGVNRGSTFALTCSRLEQPCPLSFVTQSNLHDATRDCKPSAHVRPP